MFLKEPPGLTLTWEPIRNADGSPPVYPWLQVMEVPWYEDGLSMEESVDYIGLGLRSDQGVIVLTVAGTKNQVVDQVGGSEGFSGNVVALVPERALALAKKLILLAQDAMELRGEDDGEEK